ncbi:GNAT family N-acetyltransferase [Sediminicola sp. 1XM1-17]|uniref:GNAT family N-acetyltransferase n=1 Tax=Sediminicola sp. 1XM1-17 TaxID=3127702 RepID=UPI003076A249
MEQNFSIREARPSEFESIGNLLVKVYSQLKGFPSPEEQPEYYERLQYIGKFTELPQTKLFVAITLDGIIGGAVVYFGNMLHYGSGGTATKETNASGFRLLAVDPTYRGQGLGKLLTESCIHMAKSEKQHQLIIHSTKAMQTAWNMYEKMGFVRSHDLDFQQGELPVYGFRLVLS